MRRSSMLTVGEISDTGFVVFALPVQTSDAVGDDVVFL